MNLDHVFSLFERARDLTGHRDYVVIGSLSVLGLDDDALIPGDMAMSIDVDCYTKEDPGRILDVQAALGEDSEFHRTQGYFLDPVSPSLPSLPEGWEGRMNRVERNGVQVWFLDPNDAAISKYARGEPRDQRWIRSGIANGLVSLPIVTSRVRKTSFLDADEERRAKARVKADAAWFEGAQAKAGRSRKK